jgi:hypothetical protein
MAARAGEWDEEAHAAEIVRAVLGGRADPRDPGGGPIPVHDFDVYLDDGRVIAVEVTRYNDEAQVEQQAAAARDDPRYPSLRYHWHVGMGPRYNVKTVRREAPDLLASLEARSFDMVPNVNDPAWNRDAAFESLRKLGVRLVYRLGAADGVGGGLDMGPAPLAGATAADVLVDVAERVAWRKGKAAKLSAAQADEGHLFVWVETSQTAAMAAMRSGMMPKRSPDLPADIDAVWLATGVHPPEVWQYDGRHGWIDWEKPTKQA